MIDHIRKTSEAIILLLVVLSPWTFGSVHPFFRYCLTAGIAVLVFLWALELAIQPRSIWSRYQWPVLVFLAVVVCQIVPLGAGADWISPQSSALRGELLPADIEWLADDGRGRVVPPGIYVLRINVDADSNSAVKQTGVQRLLYVAY